MEQTINFLKDKFERATMRGDMEAAEMYMRRLHAVKSGQAPD